MDVRVHPGLLERVDTPVRHRQIDRTAVFVWPRPRVGAPFIQRDRDAAASQEDREQRARRTGAGDRNIRRRHCHASRAPASISTARKQSACVLYKGTGARRMMSGSRQSPTRPAAVS